MKKLLEILAVLGLTTTGATSVVACGPANLETNKKVNLSDLSFNEINCFVKDNTNISNEDVNFLIKNIETKVLQQLQKINNKITNSDFTTTARDFIKNGSDLSKGIAISIESVENSELLIGTATAKINFALNFDLGTLENSDFEWVTSNPEQHITEIEVRERWFELNQEKLQKINSKVSVDWFITENFKPGDASTSGSAEILASPNYSEQFLNKKIISIKNTVQNSGTVDKSVGDAGKIETFSELVRINQFSNGNIFAFGVKNIYKLTEKGKIDSTIAAPFYFNKVIQLSNGTILAATPGSKDQNVASIYKLNDDATIDSSVGQDGDGLISTFDNAIFSLLQLRDGTILAGTENGSIYKLTDEGKMDSILEDKTLDGTIFSLFQLSNGTILAGTENGSIYKLTNEGKIDSKLEDKFDGSVNSITQLSNETILVGSGVKNALGSIYKLKDDGTIDTSINDTGKLENNTLPKNVLSITELSNKTVFASVGYYNSVSVSESYTYRIVL